MNVNGRRRILILCLCILILHQSYIIHKLFIYKQLTFKELHTGEDRDWVTLFLVSVTVRCPSVGVYRTVTKTTLVLKEKRVPDPNCGSRSNLWFDYAVFCLEW